MPRPIELELDLGQHHFEEAVSGSDSSDEVDSDDDGSEPADSRCAEDDTRAAVARRVQLEAVSKVFSITSRAQNKQNANREL
jgi:hypothetical protein